ncbi:MAG: alpha/beta fold hydrolase [Propionibacteriaceae bacterium]|jgi:surfactin synthase thioesterase subunit|nr:alpha/beta fold hydrolase [Propionibacteriaceae bacterium]
MLDSQGTVAFLPYAGSHADPFGPIQASLLAKGGMESVTLFYPGHGPRAAEPAKDSIAELVDDALEQLLKLPPPVHLLGFSMGGVVAFESTLIMAAMGQCPASVSFMATAPPPVVRGSGLDHSNDNELIDHCARWGLIDPSLFETSVVRVAYLPPLRADVRALDAYAARGFSGRLMPAEVSVAVFLGERDQAAAMALDDWHTATPVQPSIFVYPGGHFFITDCLEEVTQDYLGFLSDVTAKQKLQLVP